MRKLIKWLFIIGCTLITLFVAVGIFLPKSSYLQRSIVIDRPASEVYSVVSDLKQFPDWQPWDEEKYNIVFSFGELDELSERLLWQSNVADMSYGNLTVEEKVENDSVILRVIITGNTLFKLNFLLEPISENQTSLTWGFQADHGSNIFARYFSIVYGKKVNESFDEGLQNIKNIVES